MVSWSFLCGVCMLLLPPLSPQNKVDLDLLVSGPCWLPLSDHLPPVEAMTGKVAFKLSLLSK